MSLLNFFCLLLIGKELEAKKELEKLKTFNQNSYVVIVVEKVSFEKLAKEMLNQLKNDFYCVTL
jgi:hypothetical protein